MQDRSKQTAVQPVNTDSGSCTLATPSFPEAYLSYLKANTIVADQDTLDEISLQLTEGDIIPACSKIVRLSDIPTDLFQELCNSFLNIDVPLEASEMVRQEDPSEYPEAIEALSKVSTIVQTMAICAERQPERLVPVLRTQMYSTDTGLSSAAIDALRIANQLTDNDLNHLMEILQNEDGPRQQTAAETIYSLDMRVGENLDTLFDIYCSLGDPSSETARLLFSTIIAIAMYDRETAFSFLEDTIQEGSDNSPMALTMVAFLTGEEVDPSYHQRSAKMYAELLGSPSLDPSALQAIFAKLRPVDLYPERYADLDLKEDALAFQALEHSCPAVLNLLFCEDPVFPQLTMDRMNLVLGPTETGLASLFTAFEELSADMIDPGTELQDEPPGLDESGKLRDLFSVEQYITALMPELTAPTETTQELEVEGADILLIQESVVEVMHLLAELDPNKAAATLSEKLYADDINIRSVAFEVMGTTGKPGLSYLGDICMGLSHDNRHIAISCLYAIKSLGVQAFSSLPDVLEETRPMLYHPGSFAISATARSISKDNLPEAIAILGQKITEGNPKIRLRSLLVLDSLLTFEDPELAEHISDKTAEKICEIARDPQIELRERLVAVRLLGSLKSHGELAAHELAACLRDEPYLQFFALDSLQKLGSHSAPAFNRALNYLEDILSEKAFAVQGITMVCQVHAMGCLAEISLSNPEVFLPILEKRLVALEQEGEEKWGLATAILGVIATAHQENPETEELTSNLLPVALRLQAFGKTFEDSPGVERNNSLNCAQIFSGLVETAPDCPPDILREVISLCKRHHPELREETHELLGKINGPKEDIARALLPPWLQLKEAYLFPKDSEEKIALCPSTTGVIKGMVALAARENWALQEIQETLLYGDNVLASKIIDAISEQKDFHSYQSVFNLGLEHPDPMIRLQFVAIMKSYGKEGVSVLEEHLEKEPLSFLKTGIRNEISRATT